MKKYTVHYYIGGMGRIEVMANSEDEAREEIDRVFCGQEVMNDENFWIDQDALYDLEWDPDITRIDEEV